MSPPPVLPRREKCAFMMVRVREWFGRRCLRSHSLAGMKLSCFGTGHPLECSVVHSYCRQGDYLTDDYVWP